MEVELGSRLQVDLYDRAFNAPGSFGVRVGRGGRRTFFLIYRINGVRRRVSLGSYPVVSLEAARSRALEILREVTSGRDLALEDSLGIAQTVGELCSQFLELKRKELKAQTFDEYRRILSREVIPKLGSARISSVSGAVVFQLFDSIASDRGSPIMANRLRAVVSSLFQFAVSRHLIQTNPVSKVRSIVREHPSDSVLSLEQLKLVYYKLADPIPGVSKSTVGVIKILILTGQRLEDIQRIHTSQLLLDSWRVGDRVSPVTGRPHSIPLVPRLSAVYREYLPQGGGYLFAKRDGAPVSFLRREFSRISDEVRIKFNARDLRRSVKENMLKLGVREDVVWELMNSRHGRLPQCEYSYAEETRAALLKWSAAVCSISPPVKESSKVVSLF